MTIQQLSVAVIGAGMAGQTHANAWRQAGTVYHLGLPPVRLRAIADAHTPFAEDAALTVVMAAQGYPGDFARGEAIGLPAVRDPRCAIFHAGTRLTDGVLVSNGGRVLNLTARAATLAEARALAYGLVDAVDWPGGFARRDIGWRALGGDS